MARAKKKKRYPYTKPEWAKIQEAKRNRPVAHDKEEYWSHFPEHILERKDEIWWNGRHYWEPAKQPKMLPTLAKRKPDGTIITQEPPPDEAIFHRMPWY